MNEHEDRERVVSSNISKLVGRSIPSDDGGLDFSKKTNFIKVINCHTMKIIRTILVKMLFLICNPINILSNYLKRIVYLQFLNFGTQLKRQLLSDLRIFYKRL